MTKTVLCDYVISSFSSRIADDVFHLLLPQQLASTVISSSTNASAQHDRLLQVLLDSELLPTGLDLLVHDSLRSLGREEVVARFAFYKTEGEKEERKHRCELDGRQASGATGCSVRFWTTGYAQMARQSDVPTNTLPLWLSGSFSRNVSSISID